MKPPKLPSGLYYRGPVIWMRSQRRIDPFDETTGIKGTTEADIHEALQQLYARLNRPQRPDPVRACAFQETTCREMQIWDAIRIHNAESKQGTVDGQNACWGHLIRMLPRPWALTEAALYEYMGKRRREGASHATVRAEFVCLKRGLRMAREDHKRTVDIPANWPKPRVKGNRCPKRSGRLIAGPDLRNFLLAFTDKRAGQARLHAVLCLLSGVRFEESRLLEADMLKPYRHVRGTEPIVGMPYYIDMPARITKNKERRLVGLTAIGAAIYRANVPDPQEHYSAFQTASAKADIYPYFHGRSQRHTCSTIGGRCGDPYTVRLVLGRTSTVDMVYQHAEMKRLAVFAQVMEWGLELDDAVCQVLAADCAARGVEWPAEGPTVASTVASLIFGKTA